MFIEDSCKVQLLLFVELWPNVMVQDVLCKCECDFSLNGLGQPCSTGKLIAPSIMYVAGLT